MAVKWCEHHFLNPNGVHLCKLKINILAQLPFGRHGMRFTMPCNTDRIDEFPKVCCEHFKVKPSYEDIIKERAKLERERRLQRIARKVEWRRMESERNGSAGREEQTDECME
mgnify:CR=1 FL=1